MKKILSGVLAILVVFAIVPAAFANISVTLDGVQIDFDVPPQIIDNRTMVPLRAIFEALGAEVDFDNYTQTIVAEQTSVHRTVVTLQVGSNIMTVETFYLWIGMPTNEPRPDVFSSSQDFELDVPPLIIDNRTLVPARAVAESFGVNVEWNVDTQTVILSTGDVPATEPPASGEGNDSIGVLVGEWYWYVPLLGDFEGNYRVFFNADMTGSRGISALMQDFTWMTSADGYLLMDMIGAGWEFAWQHRYSISEDGNVLTLESMTTPGFPQDFMRAD
ncbi:MAG: copper amine oxidase N-terminal domain-containing protein [Oscillospiraceae bacterium]|nr:copper amine oxidase N-terminal domain-containing protein [Oscillospiraceae bacterium]